MELEVNTAEALTLLPVDLSIAQIGHVVELLRQSQSTETHVILDLSRCVDIDTAGLQLLVQVTHNKLDVELINPNQAVVEKVELLGLGDLIYFKSGDPS